MGKTIRGTIRYLRFEKHPHVHGEDNTQITVSISDKETPPRAWGRLFRLVKPIHDFRNTPTCMGKTLEFTGLSGFFGRF